MPDSHWSETPPELYDIVTGFFPETSPKETWATDPRPLLVCGRAKDNESGIYFCRVAYGTSKHIDKARDNDLVVGNMSLLNELGLKVTTRFVINTGDQMVILPWTDEFFRPWSGYDVPILSNLPDDMKRYVGFVLSELDNLPQF